jgi:high-affinity iron transporter
MASRADVSTPFDIGLREAIEAGIVIGLVGASVPRPWERSAIRVFWGGLGLAALSSIAVSWAIHDALAPTADQLTGVEVALSIVAAVTLTATALWVARRAHLAGPSAAGIPASTATVLAALAIVRETVEATWFALANPGEGGAGASPVGGLVSGGLTGLALVGAVLGVLFARAQQRSIYVLSEALLTLVAAGMLMSATRAVHDAGWSGAGSRPLIELGYPDGPSGALARVSAGVFGIQPQVTVAEALTWIVYAGVLVALSWHVSSASLRRRARRHLR